MTRSKNQPATAPKAVAAPIAARIARTFRKALLPTTQDERAASTDAATKAPKETKAEWPKFRTSIRPKTRERPDAIRKIIMPIARPATVRVSHVDGEPIATSAIRASASG